MRRRYQEGGLAAGAEDDPDQDQDSSVADPEGDEANIPSGAITASGGLSALDIPGAQEAFSLMAKSSEDARKALQQARESIMQRQYSKADAWLAASAALGAPTRSGSTAESFANMAGALRGPLAAHSQFDIQKQKDLLGVNTQLAGIDDRQAQAQLALAQLRARLAIQAGNAPLEKVLVPGQKDPVYKTRPEARGLPAWTPPGAQTNVNVSTDKSLYGKMAEQLGEEYVGQYKTAANAQNIIDRNKQVRDLLAQSPYTGAAADWKLKLGKAAKAAGFNYAANDIKNTEVLFSTLGKETLENIHASGLGSGNGFTDKDLEFLRQVVGGTINLDKGTISDLAELHERAARLSVKKWNRTYGLLKPDLMKELGLTPVSISEPENTDTQAGGSDADTSPQAPAVGAPANPSAAEGAAKNPGTVSFYDLKPRKQ